MCGKCLPLMPRIFLKDVFSIQGVNESPIRDLRYYWMTDNDTLCWSPKCPLMYAVVVISVHAKRYQFVDGKYFGYRDNCNGGSRMIAVWWIWIYDALCKSACHQLDVGKLQFYFGSSNHRLVSLDERFNWAIMCMNIRYLMM
jgi:hypothetical protein